MAKGFDQIEGFDYIEIFSFVVKNNTIRVVLAHVITAQWSTHQIDVNNVFLNGVLEENVYMQQHPGFVSKDPTPVCELHKAIYGLKQAPRSWFQKLN